MEINITKNDKVLNVSLTGRLDTQTSPELDAAVKGYLADIEKIVFDFEKLEYISSAGLRLLLVFEKTLKAKENVVLKNVNNVVKEILSISGFNQIITIE